MHLLDFVYMIRYDARYTQRQITVYKLYIFLDLVEIVMLIETDLNTLHFFTIRTTSEVIFMKFSA